MPSTYSFLDLHVAIQDAMGWHDKHHHAFRIKASNGQRLNFSKLEDHFGTLNILPESNNISQYISKDNPTFEYVYDFGDNWRHEVELEEVLSTEKDVAYPRCIGGERACPPEDCEGPWGYQDLLEVLSDPNHEGYEIKKAWVENMKGGPFDPGYFDPRTVDFRYPKEQFRKRASADQ